MAAERKIQIKKLFFDSALYCVKNWHEMALFSIVNILFMIVGFKILNAWHDGLFLLWLVPYYMFWYFFFRFYFGRKPYMLTLKIFETLLPSTRILGITLFFVTILIILPLLIPFISGDEFWVERYLYHLQKYTEESQMLNLMTMIILSVISPLIFYRPMMAWIGSVIGRSSLLSTAYARTKGNYWQFLLITVFFNAIFTGLELADVSWDMGSWPVILLGSPVVVFMNIVLAKTYEYFFMEID